ncbi:hypothetical protein MAR_003491 [Mya arenaria]|uniref:Secreted protein n=1 Tax=Mya arenaria TaxID=6604 RepID=A0ABY7G678_MYAAR|nr:hypothetical protein MAR_003491 [Mya arenaria]
MWCCLYILCSDLQSESSHKRVKYVVLRFRKSSMQHLMKFLTRQKPCRCKVPKPHMNAHSRTALFMRDLRCCCLWTDLRIHALRKQREERLSSVPDCVREKTITIVTHIDYFNCENKTISTFTILSPLIGA